MISYFEFGRARFWREREGEEAGVEWNGMECVLLSFTFCKASLEIDIFV